MMVIMLAEHGKIGQPKPFGLLQVKALAGMVVSKPGQKHHLAIRIMLCQRQCIQR